MVTLLVTRGYPGSGKTTLARKYVEENPNWARVNRDDIRFMLFEKYSGLNEQEDVVTIAQREMVMGLLRAGINVVVDDTNLNPRTMRGWKTICYMVDAELEVVDITTEAWICIERDQKRQEAGERFVGKDVIEFFAEKYPMPWDPA